MLRWLAYLIQFDHPNENIRLRGRNVIITALALAVLGSLSFFYLLYNQNTIMQALIITMPATLINSMIAFLVRRHVLRVTLGATLILSTMTLGILSSFYVVTDNIMAPFFLVMSILFAGLMLPPRLLWVVLLGVVTCFWIILLTHPARPLDQNVNIISTSTATLFLVIVTLMVFLGARTALKAKADAKQQQTTAEQVADDLEMANMSLEHTVAERTAALQRSFQALQERELLLSQKAADLRASQSAIQSLSAPVVPVLPGVIIAPIVGALTHERAQLLMHNVLTAIKDKKEHTVILDISSVLIVDTHVAQTLTQTARAAQLMGAAVLLVGIRPEVAHVLVSLDVTLESMRIFADLRQAVASLRQQHL